jgi:hypothetical protein
MAHDIKIRLFGKVFTKVMKRAAMDMNDLMAPQTNQVVGMAHRKKEKPGLPRLGHLDLFRNLFIRKSLQRPIYGGKVEACPFLYQSFIDFIGRQDFLSAKKKTQDLKTGLGQFQAILTDNVFCLEGFIHRRSPP